MEFFDIFEDSSHLSIARLVKKKNTNTSQVYSSYEIKDALQIKSIRSAAML